MTQIESLRQATEDDVIEALKHTMFGTWPQDPAALLEFFNRMIDVKLGEAAGGMIMWHEVRRDLN